MKRFKHIFRAFLAVLLINLTTYATAQEKAETWIDSVDISLLTCGPGQEVWSYYGHTALRIEDRTHGNDLAVNWGMFSFKQDYFIPRFVFGLTDYQIGIFPMSYFIDEYTREGRWVRQQRLALSREEKVKILSAIDENNKEENRTYRYNFFFDNCTTRARNMILGNLSHPCQEISGNETLDTSYRKEIHRWNENHRWARFGNDLLLGCNADKPISREEWEFLPVNLMQDFDKTKLVDKAFYVIPPQAETAEAECITPLMVFLTLGIVVVLVSAWEVWKKKNLWWIDTLLFILTGIPGLILLAMVFSQHPTVQVNFQILILNPLNLIFVWQVSKKLKQGKLPRYYGAWGAMLCFAIALMTRQDYAEGIGFLALSLLVRHALKTATNSLKIAKEKENIQK